MRWQRNLFHQGALKVWGEKPQSSLKHVPQKPVQNICSTQKGFEHKQRTPKIAQIAEINKNATRELHYSKPSSGYWILPFQCLHLKSLCAMPSLCWAHLKETKEIWSMPVLPCTVHGKGCTLPLKPSGFQKWSRSKKEREGFSSLGSSWEGWSSPTTFLQIEMPAAYQTPLYCHLQPAPNVT